MTTQKEREQQEAIEQLKKHVKPGDTIYTQLKHVSQSGMFRVIDLFVIKDNEPIRLSYSAATLLEGYNQKHEGCKATGCGMDMGFSLVYRLSSKLYLRYECLGDNCPSNDHVNDYKSPQGKGIIHNNGYCLRHRWF